MIKLTVFLILCLSLTSANLKPKKVIFFGDSITEIGVQDGGYIDILQKRLQKENKSKDFVFKGAGIGGNKVYDLFFRLEHDVLSQKPDIVVIWIGVNDVWHKSTFGTGTDFDKFVKFYEEIIHKCQSAGIKVYCCTPAAIGEKTDHSNPQDGDLNELSKIIRVEAKKKSAEVIDFRNAFLEYNLKFNVQNVDKGILTNDRVHLNDAGNKLVADMIWHHLME
jgi:lysophospholipase L1-like esterase